MYDFLSAVCDGKPSHPDFDDAAYVQSVIDAAYRSAELGAKIKI